MLLGILRHDVVVAIQLCPGNPEKGFCWQAFGSMLQDYFQHRVVLHTTFPIGSLTLVLLTVLQELEIAGWLLKLGQVLQIMLQCGWIESVAC